LDRLPVLSASDDGLAGVGEGAAILAPMTEPPEEQLDAKAQAVVDGRAWTEFCAALERAGQTILSPRAPSDPRNRAEGFRHLTRLIRAGLEAFVEHADPEAPALRRMVHETVKMGADNPDNHYLNACINGAYEYRITGNRGTVDYLAFATQKGGVGESRGMPPTGFVEASELDIGPNGELELWLSQEPKPGKNHLPMEPDTGLLLVRQTFLDREREVPATLKIERVGSDNRARHLTPSALAWGLDKTAMLVTGAPMLFGSWAEGFRRQPNELPLFDPERCRMAGGDPSIAYYHGYWRLAPDEALVIDLEPPPCQTWNFQVDNWWMESLDYRYYPVVINKHGARVRPDGSVRLILCDEDPKLDGPAYNWLTTTGLREGTMLLRWVRAEHPEPVSTDPSRPEPEPSRSDPRPRVVRLDELAGLDGA
jgi:hypothetical protein